jgi:multiple sugar transport system substrate-binding protein
MGIFLIGNFQNSPFFGGNSQITLAYWGIDEPESVMQPLIDQYQSLHPNVSIHYERRTLTQYRQTLQTRISQSTGPDIFRFHNTWLPMIKDSLDPIPGNVYSTQDFQNLFYPVVRENLTSNGNIYGIPLEYDGLALIYNPDMLAAKSFHSAPTTWSDILEVYGSQLTQLNANHSVAVGTAALGTSTNIDYFSDILGVMMLQNGVQMIDNTHQVSIATSTATSAGVKRNLGSDVLNFYTLLAKGFPLSGNNPLWDDTLPSSSQAFATGRVAMIIVPSRALPDLQNLINQNKSGVKIAVAPLPQILPPNEGSPVYWATYWAEGVSKNSKNKAVAWDFLKFLSSKESEVTLYNEEVKARGFGEAPSRTDLADRFRQDAIVSGFLAGAKNAHSWYLSSGTDDQGVNDGLIKIFGDAVTSVLKQGDSSDIAIKKAAKDAAGVLSQYQLSLPDTSLGANQ